MKTGLIKDISVSNWPYKLYGVLDNVRIFVCKDFEEAEGWINKDGVFEKMDWLEAEEEDKLYDLSKEELIEIIRRDIPYNPRREV